MLKNLFQLSSLVILSALSCSHMALAGNLCCSGSNITPQQCCEQNNGVWCNKDNKCYAHVEYEDHVNTALFQSPCMDESMCNNTVYGIWCDKNEKCYSWYSQDYVDACITSSDECNAAAQSGSASYHYWCNSPSPGKCYYYAGTYKTSCQDSEESKCALLKERSPNSYFWCAHNQTCYNSSSSYYTGCGNTKDHCEDLPNGRWCTANNGRCYNGWGNYMFQCTTSTEEDCIEAGSAYKWCSAESTQRCYPLRSSPQYATSCAKVTQQDCSIDSRFKYCALNERCYPNQKQYNNNCK